MRRTACERVDVTVPTAVFRSTCFSGRDRPVKNVNGRRTNGVRYTRTHEVWGGSRRRTRHTIRVRNNNNYYKIILYYYFFFLLLYARVSKGSRGCVAYVQRTTADGVKRRRFGNSITTVSRGGVSLSLSRYFFREIRPRPKAYTHTHTHITSCLQCYELFAIRRQGREFVL